VTKGPLKAISTMSDQNSISNPLASLERWLRDIMREEIRAALDGDKRQTARKDWLRAEELAEEYGLPRTWFEERGRAGDIARTKPGRYVLFKRRDVEAYLEQNKKTCWPKRKKKMAT